MSEADIARRIGELVAAGRKIEAIGLLREATGLGLADAKNVIESVGSGAPLPLELRQRLDAGATAATEEPLPDEVLAVAAAGNRIEAIRLLRAQRGLGLKQAKDLLDRAVPAPAGNQPGCLLPLLGVGLCVCAWSLAVLALVRSA